MTLALVTPFLVTLALVTLGPYDPCGPSPYDPSDHSPHDPGSCDTVPQDPGSATLILMAIVTLELMTLANPSPWPWLS